MVATCPVSLNARPAALADDGRTDGLELHASVPVRGRGGPLGILNLGAPGDWRLTADELAFLDVVGRQLSVALEWGGDAEAPYRIAQQGIDNAVRHGETRHVRIARERLIDGSESAP